jgi:hypothetical protein
LNGINALDRTRCGYNTTQNLGDVWIQKLDFFRLRYVTLSYRVPAKWIPGSRGGTLSLAGRNLFLSTLQRPRPRVVGPGRQPGGAA